MSYMLSSANKGLAARCYIEREREGEREKERKSSTMSEGNVALWSPENPSSYMRTA